MQNKNMATNNKLVCVKNDITKETKRVPRTEAEILIKKGFQFISKSAYKSFLNSTF